MYAVQFGFEVTALCEEALALQAAQGDDTAMAELIRCIMPLARAKAAVYSGLRIGEEDLLQEGMLGFLNAVRSFEASREVSFRNYAAVCIQNRILSAVRSQASGKHAALNTALPLTEILLAADDPQDIFSAREDAAALQDFLQQQLSDLERSVALLFLAGERYGQIAQTLGVSNKAVDNALQRVRKKLHAHVA